MSEQVAGRLSLSAAIVGLLLGVLLPIGYALASLDKPSYVLSLLWLVPVSLLEFVALACAILGRRTDSGLAGLTLACAVFLLLFCLLW